MPYYRTAMKNNTELYHSDLYYGVLMKDGTELTHFGVKGMKWGKHIFGKVKGVFGKGADLAGKGFDVLTAKGPLQKGIAKNEWEKAVKGKQPIQSPYSSSSPASPTLSDKKVSKSSKPKKRYEHGVMLVDEGYIGNTHYSTYEVADKKPTGKKVSSKQTYNFSVPTIDPVFTSKPLNNGGYGLYFPYKIINSGKEYVVRKKK